MRYPSDVSTAHPATTSWRRLLLAGSALWLANLVPGGAQAMTLQEALAAAYTNNPTLLAQRARCARATKACRNPLGLASDRAVHRLSWRPAQRGHRQSRAER